jgi:hypothetical protein
MRTAYVISPGGSTDCVLCVSEIQTTPFNASFMQCCCRHEPPPPVTTRSGKLYSRSIAASDAQKLWASGVGLTQSRTLAVTRLVVLLVWRGWACGERHPGSTNISSPAPTCKFTKASSDRALVQDTGELIRPLRERLRRRPGVRDTGGG